MKNSQTAVISVLITLLVILLPIGAFVAANYHLIFEKPKIEVVHLPEMKILYLDHAGSYDKAPTFIVEIYQAMAKAKINCLDLLGQYYDTGLVPEDKRRSRYACVVKEFPQTIPAGFKSGTLPESDYARTMRYEQGPFVTSAYGMRLTQFSQVNDYSQRGYILEMYTPGRIKRGHAEMYQAIIKREPMGEPSAVPPETGAMLPDLGETATN